MQGLMQGPMQGPVQGPMRRRRCCPGGRDFSDPCGFRQPRPGLVDVLATSDQYLRSRQLEAEVCMCMWHDVYSHVHCMCRHRSSWSSQCIHV